MEIKGSYLFNAPVERVFDALLDPNALRICIPGCERFEAVESDLFAVTVRIGVAAVKGTYGGTVRLKDIARPSEYTLEAEGISGPGFVKATVGMRLEAQSDKTVLHWSADARIGGRIASVGARMLGGIATHTANQFFECVAQQISGAAAPA